MTGHHNSLHPSANSIHSVKTFYLFPRILTGTYHNRYFSSKRYMNGAWRKYSVCSIHSICCDASNVVTNSTFTGANSATIIFCLWYFFADRVYTNNANNKIRRFANTLASDILLGLAIFTKIPIFSNLSKRL